MSRCYAFEPSMIMIMGKLQSGRHRLAIDVSCTHYAISLCAMPVCLRVQCNRSRSVPNRNHVTFVLSLNVLPMSNVNDGRFIYLIFARVFLLRKMPSQRSACGRLEHVLEIMNTIFELWSKNRDSREKGSPKMANCHLAIRMISEVPHQWFRRTNVATFPYNLWK